jgi:uncharacterized Zn finger protein
MGGRSWDDPWKRYPESRPLATTGGIPTSKQRGAMAATWWSKRFIEVLESYGLGTRMQRGRRYARSGQVLSLDVTPGLLVAQVQGSRRIPYVVSIHSTPPTEHAWSTLQEALQARVGFVARLLAGEVPPELEDACTDAGIALFPRAWAQLSANCNCPDWENPCKHLAAVLYVFADQLDADPWLLLSWRGRTREELLAHLDTISSTRRADGLPAWWPLVPGGANLGRLRWRPPQATPAEPAHATLSRLPPLDISHGETPVTELIALAYPALAISEWTTATCDNGQSHPARPEVPQGVPASVVRSERDGDECCIFLLYVSNSDPGVSH